MGMTESNFEQDEYSPTAQYDNLLLHLLRWRKPNDLYLSNPLKWFCWYSVMFFVLHCLVYYIQHTSIYVYDCVYIYIYAPRRGALSDELGVFTAFAISGSWIFIATALRAQYGASVTSFARWFRRFRIVMGCLCGCQLHQNGCQIFMPNPTVLPAQLKRSYCTLPETTNK